MPWAIFFCALNNKLIPLLLIKKIPTRAVNKIIEIVGSKFQMVGGKFQIVGGKFQMKFTSDQS